MEKSVVINEQPQDILREQLDALTRSAKAGVFRIFCDISGNINLNDINNWFVINPTILGFDTDCKLTISDTLALFYEDGPEACFEAISCAILGGCNRLDRVTHIPNATNDVVSLRLSLRVSRSGDKATHIDGDIKNISSEQRIIKNFSDLSRNINTNGNLAVK